MQVIRELYIFQSYSYSLFIVSWCMVNFQIWLFQLTYIWFTVKYMDEYARWYSIVRHAGVVAGMRHARCRNKKVWQSLYRVCSYVDTAFNIVVDHSTVVVPDWKRKNQIYYFYRCEAKNFNRFFVNAIQHSL